MRRWLKLIWLTSVVFVLMSNYSFAEGDNIVWSMGRWWAFIEGVWRAIG